MWKLVWHRVLLVVVSERENNSHNLKDVIIECMEWKAYHSLKDWKKQQQLSDYISLCVHFTVEHMQYKLFFSLWHVWSYREECLRAVSASTPLGTLCTWDVFWLKHCVPEQVVQLAIHSAPHKPHLCSLHTWIWIHNMLG